MKVRRTIKVVTALALSMAVLAGCGGGGGQNAGGGGETQGNAGAAAGNANQSAASDGDVVIKFVHKFPEEKRMQYFNEVIADFEAQNPGIKIQMTAYGDEEIKDKTRVLLGSDDAPDIFFTWSGERITQYVDSGNAMDITKYLEEDADWKNSFNQSMLGCCLKNDSYWAIPWDYSSKEMVYL